MARSRPQLIPALILIGISAYFSLKNLGDSYLWQDEAQTALVSRTILQRGIPYGTDGLNFFSQELGAEYGKDHLWQWHMWLPFYAVAVAFGVIGETTFSARLPFALGGILAVVAVFRYLLLVCRGWIPAFCGALSLSLYVPFLLLTRQSRYYSFLMLFTVLTLYFYERWLRSRRPVDMFYLSLSAACLFHTHYLHFAVAVVPIVVHWLWFDRKDTGQCLGGSVILLVLCGPWITFIANIKYTSAYAGSTFTVDHFWEGLHGYGRLIRRYIFVWPLVLGICWSVLQGRHRRSIGLLIATTLTTLVVLSLTSPAPFFRYLAPEIALAAICLGLALDTLEARVQRLAVFLVVGLVILRSDFKNFVYEIHHSFRGPVAAIVERLQKEAKPHERVLMTYDDLSVKFYTKLKVFGGLTGESLDGAQNAEWVIPRHTIVCSKDQLIADFINTEVDLSRYEKIELNATDTVTENREEPELHLFSSPTGEPKVVVYHRRLDE